MLNRPQTRSALLAIPISLFYKRGDIVQILLMEETNVWINVTDLITFLPSQSDSFKFIYPSERTGYRHLYLIESSLNKEIKGSFSFNAINVSQITCGDWVVMNSKLWIHNDAIYFSATKDTPLECHFYKTSLDVSGFERGTCCTFWT